jgi:NodT family efflux transporter outer membrane factor (OMF) lipoprotein
MAARSPAPETQLGRGKNCKEVQTAPLCASHGAVRARKCQGRETPPHFPTDPPVAMSQSVPHSRMVLLLAFTVGLAGCASAPTTPPQTQLVPAHFSASGQVTAQRRWWRELHDPALDRLVAQALRDNPGLDAVEARLRQAREVWRQAGADRLPTLDLGVSATEAANAATTNDSRSVTLTAGYEVDLWGRLAAAERSKGFTYRATAEDLQTSALTLSAEVSRTWYEMVAQRETLQLIAEQEKTAESYLEVLRLRFVAGRARAADILQQRELVASLKGERAQAESALATARHAMAALLGRSPDQAPSAAEAALPALPPLPKTGLPAELLSRRPDLRQARFTLRATEEDVAVAAADRLPKLTLTGTAASRAEAWADLLQDWSRTLVANLTAALFDGGRRRAEVERTRARVEEAVANYRKTILDALVEVEDALAQERQQRSYLNQVDTRVRLSRQILERQTDYYRSGGGDFLNVLDAQRTLQARERERITARRQLIEYRIALYRALAGGILDVPTVGQQNPQDSEQTAHDQG